MQDRMESMEMAGDRLAGYAFRPADHELITGYLRPKIAGEIVFHDDDDDIFMHETDAYSVAPVELVENRKIAPGSDSGDGKGCTWYFFSPARRYQSARGGSAGRRQRAVGAAGEGCWKAEGAEKPVLDADGRRVGHLRKLSYGIKQPGTGKSFTRLGWCMAEYGLDQQDGRDLVLCKVYRSPRAESSTAVTMPASSSCSKRKATDNLSPPSSGYKRKAADDHPEVPQSVRMALQDIENFLFSDGDPLPAGVDDSVDPAGFFGDMLADLQRGGGEAAAAEDGSGVGSLVQTVDGPRTEHEVLEALAMGVSLDDLLCAAESDNRDMPCPAPALRFSRGGDVCRSCPVN